MRCNSCYLYTRFEICPLCQKKTTPTCEKDHPCSCLGDIHEGTYYCGCGNPTCPCGSHDVVQISRVTGYLSDVKGWNAAKKQELIDRQRY